MLSITLYKFAKRKNSTKQPANTDTHTDLTGYMKTPSSIIEPVITVKASPIGYNYAYVSDFSRYYFINDIVYSMGEWSIYLSSDPLASFKTTLGGLSAYVLRSASTKNGYLKDKLYPLTGKHTKSVQDWNPTPITGAGNVYLTVASVSAGQNALMMTMGNFTTLINELMGYGGDANLWQTIQQAIQNQTYNPIQYINSAYFCPIQFSSSGGGQLTVGDYPTSAYYTVVTSPYSIMTHSFTIASHPQASTRGLYCNMAPYSEHTVSAGPFGQFNIPSDLLTESTNTVELEICIDTRNGSAVLVAKCNGIRFARLSSSVGVTIPVAQVSRDIIGGSVSVASGIASAAVAGWTGNAGMLLPALASALGGVEALSSSVVSTTGALGCLANLYDNYHISSVYYEIADDDNTNNGRPLCDYVQINTLSGFMQCEKGIFRDTTAVATEISEINSYMVSGFYYE